MMNITKSKTTTVAVVGVSSLIDVKRPKNIENTDIATEHNMTDLKFLNIFMADKGGKTISADIKSEPVSIIARLIVIATNMAISIL